MGKKNTRMTPALFQQVKDLQSYGVKAKHIREITGLSESAQTIVKRSSDVEGYHEINRGYRINHEMRKTNDTEVSVADLTAKEQKNVAAQEDTEAVAFFAADDEPQRKTYTDHQMERIANALERSAAAHERMADAWEAAPATRKSIFRS